MKYSTRLLCLLTLLILGSLTTFAQRSQWSQAYAQGNYQDCIDLCNAQLDKDHDDASAYYFKGASHVNLRQYHEGIEALRKAQILNFPNTTAIHAMHLRAEAGLKNTDSLIKRLDSLTEQGFAAIQLFSQPEFGYLANNEDFLELKQKVDMSANPCKYGSQYKRLDFWLGAWDVYTNGNKSADSFITKSEGGCTLHEDYRTQSGFFGRSFNYYDPKDSLYTQIWIDKFNSIIRFKEEQSREGFLIMGATSPSGNLVRMTYELDTTNQSVTQTMEVSNDAGKTWTPNFVGEYRRKSQPEDPSMR